MQDYFPEHDLDAGAPDRSDDMSGRLQNAADARRFALAGKATITLVSQKTGMRFTYKISTSEDGNCHFVGLLTGADNENAFQYIGRIARGIFWAGRKNPRPGDISKDAPGVRAFDWTWRALVQDSMPAQLEIWHEGICGRCGRKLTVPSSIASGFGPECITKI